MKRFTINKSDLKYNLNRLKSVTNKEILPIVKCNGYGLGEEFLSQFLYNESIKTLGTSTIESALNIKKSGYKGEIFLLSSYKEKEDLTLLIENDIIITLDNLDQIKFVSSYCREKNKSIKSFIAFDTGMGRFGFIPYDVSTVIEIIKTADFIDFVGIFTHLYASFAKGSNISEIQYNEFSKIINTFKQNNIDFKYISASNSHGIINYNYADENLVRLGSALLGRVSPRKGLKTIGKYEASVLSVKDLKKGHNVSYGGVCTLKKDTRVAVIDSGFEDGIFIEKIENAKGFLAFLRSLKKLVFDKKDLYCFHNDVALKVLGRVSANHFMVDIQNLNIKIGDMVEIKVNPMMLSPKVLREYED